MPAADVYTRHLLALLIFTEIRPLVVAVDVVADTSHQRIVHVAGVMPDAVFLSYPHMAHLDGQEVLDDGLPDASVVDIIGNAEYARLVVAVAHLIEPGFRHVAEISREVAVAQELSPDLRRHLADNGFPIGIDADELNIIHRSFALVCLDDDMLRLLRQIAHLRCLDDGGVSPRLIDGGRDEPADGSLRNPRRNLTAKHKPAVVMVHATVVELQVASQRLHRQPLTTVIRAGGKLATDGVRRSNDVVCTEGAVACSVQLCEVCLLPTSGEVVAVVASVCRQLQ